MFELLIAGTCIAILGLIGLNVLASVMEAIYQIGKALLFESKTEDD